MKTYNNYIAVALTDASLRTDAIKERDWNPEWENGEFVMPNPVLAIYYVRTDSMYAAGRDAIFKNDNLRAEIIPVDKIEPHETYIVTDKAGNTYLGWINKFSKNTPIVIEFLNPSFQEVQLNQCDIAEVAMVYMMSRTTEAYWSDEFEFTPEQKEAMTAFVGAKINSKIAKKAGAVISNNIKNGEKTAVPFIPSTQLFPDQMISEANDPNTSPKRKAHLIDAFVRGYNVMKRLNVPAKRILFIQYAGLDKIEIWFD